MSNWKEKIATDSLISLIQLQLLFIKIVESAAKKIGASAPIILNS